MVHFAMWIQYDDVSSIDDVTTILIQSLSMTADAIDAKCFARIDVSVLVGSCVDENAEHWSMKCYFHLTVV